MEPNRNNIYPIHDRLLQQEAKEEMLKQRGYVLWFTGLSGSGKSTIAQHLEAKMHENGFVTKVLDGDNIRSGLNKNLTFTPEDIQENIRRISEVSKLFIRGGIICINSFIAPSYEARALAKEIIGEDRFLEIYVSASLETCEKRDVKGLYAKARRGEIKGFIGIGTPYDAPKNPFIEVKTDDISIEEGVELIYSKVLHLLRKGF